MATPIQSAVERILVENLQERDSKFMAQFATDISNAVAEQGDRVPGVTTLKIYEGAKIELSDPNVLETEIADRTYDNVDATFGKIKTKLVPLGIAEDMLSKLNERESAILSCNDAIENEIYDNNLYNWALATATARTTGTAVAGIGPAGATRKGLTLDDIALVAARFRKAKVRGVKVGFIPAFMYADFVSKNKEVLDADYKAALGITDGFPTGVDAVYLQAFGIVLVSSSYSPLYLNADGTKLPFGTAETTDHSYAAMFFAKESVVYGRGALKAIVQENVAQYEGGTLIGAATVYASGPRRKADSNGAIDGIYTIVQTN